MKEISKVLPTHADVLACVAQAVTLKKPLGPNQYKMWQIKLRGAEILLRELRANNIDVPDSAAELLKAIAGD